MKNVDVDIVDIVVVVEDDDDKCPSCWKRTRDWLSLDT